MSVCSDISRTAGRSGAGAATVSWCLAAVAALTLLAGCGTLSGRSGSSAKPGDAQSSRSAGGVPRKSGGYYLDDGPGDNAPANLDMIADAVPRAEPLQRGTSRPYAVMGRSYTPMTALGTYRERGTATWYGRRYHGQRTSSGEIYDMYAMTGAHTTLPIPSYARVTNLANGRSVVVRINDRGPFLDERLIDLSYVAAYKLDILRNGSARVEVESVLPETYTASAPATSAAAGAPAVAVATSLERPTQPAAPSMPVAAPLLADSAGHYLQLGAFSVRENAERFIERMRSELADMDATLNLVASDSLYRIQAGPYASRSAALQAAERIGQTLGAAPILTAPR